MKATITFEHVSIGYNKTLIADIDETIYENDFICLMGKNGTGKTTLLKTLLGHIKPLQGDIKLFNKNLHDYSRSEIAKLISVVLTQQHEIQNMSVYDLIALGRIPYVSTWGRLSKHDHYIIDEGIDFFDLSEIINQDVATLSDGQLQKCYLARSYIQDTPIIVLDEPTSFLDVVKKNEVMYILKEVVRKKNKSIFYTSHDWNLALNTTDLTWALMDQRIKTGTPEDLILSNDIQDCFASPNIKFNPYKGDFVFSHDNDQTKKRVIVNCDNNEKIYLWTEHILLKNGFTLLHESPPKYCNDIVVITVKDDVWYCDDFKCNTLKEMVTYLI